MLHQQAIGIGKGLLGKISEKCVLINELGQFIIILTVVVISSFISFYFFEKPANALVKRLFGYGKK
jgi:peptidoglycan/LPS O-acetylase OafA/YrhL